MAPIGAPSGLVLQGNYGALRSQGFVGLRALGLRLLSWASDSRQVLNG